MKASDTVIGMFVYTPCASSVPVQVKVKGLLVAGAAIVCVFNLPPIVADIVKVCASGSVTVPDTVIVPYLFIN